MTEMNKLKVFLKVLLIVIIGYSCNNSNIDIEYYDSGNVKRKLEYYDQDNYFVINYYDNGNIKTKGEMLDSLKTGVWQEYFSDGDLRWEGVYSSNILDELSESDEDIITLDNNPKFLILGHTYKIRIKTPEKHLENISVSVNKGNKVFPSLIKDEYDFLLEPLIKGDLSINLYLRFGGEIYKVRTNFFQVSD